MWSYRTWTWREDTTTCTCVKKTTVPVTLVREGEEVVDYCSSYVHCAGNLSKIQYRTLNKNLTIRLVSDESTSGRGFNLTFTKYYMGTPFQGNVIIICCGRIRSFHVPANLS